MRVRARVPAMLVAVLVAAPMPAVGQAICSAPHSSPMLAQSGSIGTMPAGAGYVQFSVLGQRSTEGFNPLGERQAFIGGSTFDTRSAYLTAAYGLLDGLEVWAQLPAHRLSVSGGGGAAEGNGVGDARAAVRLSSAIAGYELPIAVRFGVKVPGEVLPVDARVLPITEGQRDFEVSLESGWSSPDYPVYAVGWVGYRWRGENRTERFEPGDERFAHAAVGGRLGRIALELGVDALWGLSPIEQNLRLASGRRRLIQLLPTVGSAVGPGTLELTAAVPVSGRNLPAGPGLSLGYRVVWGL